MSLIMQRQRQPVTSASPDSIKFQNCRWAKWSSAMTLLCCATSSALRGQLPPTLPCFTDEKPAVCLLSITTTEWRPEALQALGRNVILFWEPLPGSATAVKVAEEVLVESKDKNFPELRENPIYEWTVEPQVGAILTNRLNKVSSRFLSAVAYSPGFRGQDIYLPLGLDSASGSKILISLL